MSEKIQAILILEILGKPAEHIIESLNKIIDKIPEEKGVSLIDKKVHEAKQTKDNPEFFSSFAEVEVEVESIMHIAMLMFKYMPAYVQIVSPEKMNVSNIDLSELFSELTRKLHGYDEVARVLQMEKGVLEKKLKSIMSENTEKK